jgi:hypothetical protein
MSSSLATPPAAATGAPEAPPSRAETVIEQHLRQARRQVKGVDLAAGLLRLTIGILLFLLAFAILDHWLVTGGLGILGRVLAALVLFAVAGAYVAREILPAIRFRIHPLFAAQALERGRPGVKNSLINFLLLREHRQQMRPAVYDAVQRRAAADVTEIEVEAAVDRAHVFRLGYVLAGVLALCCLYFVASPKSLFTSAARLLWPFGGIPAPTRVTISEITPGNATVYLGDPLTVTGVVSGLRDEEPVTLFFSTTDGQLVDQAVPMTLPAGDYRHRAELPPGARGFQQDATYILAAGDFRSRPFHIEVQTAPAIVVDRVVLEYPAYTGLAPRTLRRQGDLQALEGTRATIYAEANQPIRRAEINLGADGKRSIGMKVDDRKAAGNFTLRLATSDATRPEFDTYQLRLVDKAGRENPRPIRHRIEVIRDLPPEVALVEPQKQQVRVPADGKVTLRVRAEDPDFGLSRVWLRAVSNGRELETPYLLKQTAAESGFRGAFTGEYAFRPQEFSLQPGDRVLYWAEAEDIRQPTPGRAETDRRWIEVVAPTGEPAADDRRPAPPDPSQAQPKPGETGQPQKSPLEEPNPQAEPATPEPATPEQPSDDTQTEPQPDPPQPGKQDESGEQKGEQDGQGEGAPGGKQQTGQEPGGQDGAAGSAEAEPSKPVDPDTNPGDAIEKILEHRRQQEGEQPEQSKPSDQKQPGEQSEEQSEEQSPGDQAQQQPGQKPPTEEQPGAQPSEPQQPGEQAGKQPGEQAGEQPSDTQAQQQPGGKPQSKDPTGAGQSEQQPDGQQSDQPGGKPGQQQPGNQPKPGEEPAESSEPGTGDQPAGQQPHSEPGGQDGEQQATPGQKPAGADASPTEPQGGPTDNSGDQPPGPMQPSPGSGDPAAKRQPGATDPSRDKPSGQKPSDGDATGTADRSGGQADPQMESGQREPGAQPQDGGTQPEEAMRQQSPSAGNQSEQPSGSPSPQEDNVDRPRNPGQAGGETSQKQEQSPGISPKQSDSQGDTAGDRAGGGEEGGGQRANQPGVGSPGSQTDAESGGGVSQQPGDGEPGDKAGDQIESDRPTGSSAPRPGGAGSDRGKPGEQQPGEGSERPSDGSTPPGEPMQNPPDGGQAGDRVSEGPGALGSGSPTQGGSPNSQQASTDGPAGEPGAEAANLEFARKQTELALEHLKDEANRPNSELLDQLGWSEAEAKRFIDQWEKLRRRAGPDNAQGQQARRDLDQALRSLGLRPRGTELKRGTTQTERIEGVRESGRFRPPADWAEQFEAYTRSIAEGDR